MKVLVCGGRQFEHPRFVGRTLAAIHLDTKIDLIITGGASGADRYAEGWGRHNRVAVCVFPANWNHDGRAAGPIRNANMLRFAKPDLVVAFPGGPGTHDMITKARTAGVEVRTFAP